MGLPKDHPTGSEGTQEVDAPTGAPRDVQGSRGGACARMQSEYVPKCFFLSGGSNTDQAGAEGPGVV